MRYLGSKASTLPAIERLLADRTPGPGTLCDPFGGVGVVGAHFRALGWTVYSCDLLHCAHHFQVARLELDEPPISGTLTAATGARSAEEFVNYLNALPPVRSWVYREFSLQRQYFTPTNATRIDAVRTELARLQGTGALVGRAKAYYSACLIDAADRVANTAGTYYAYLKDWNRKALGQFAVDLIKPAQGPRGQSSISDATTLVPTKKWDLLYLDPPYNDRDYAGYYHFPETLASGRDPLPTGRSGVDSSPRPRSEFSSPRSAVPAMQALLHAARFATLLLHYSDDGLIPAEWLRPRLNELGSVEEHVIDATGYSTGGTRGVKHRLYLVQS